MELNQSTQDGVEQAVVERLIEQGWLPCTGEAAIARKSFQTAVGEKTSNAFLSRGDGFNRSLHGNYQSEGRNILSGSSVLIPLGADINVCASLAKEFADNVETEVENSYAGRIATPSDGVKM